jgi:hypothetical protein
MLAVSLSKKRSEQVKEVKEVVVRWCSERYNFVASEALEEMGDLLIGDSKIVKKSKFVLPYNGEHNEECCNGLRKNVGLYTQCQVKKKVNEKYCKTCQNSAEKNDGVPEYGTIEGRLAVEIYEYVDPKGRKPTSYAKIMKKLNLSKEDVLAEGKRLNIVINEKHFEEEEVKVTDVKRGRPKVEKAPKEPKGAKGRPKKTKKVVEVNGDNEPEDLFASLVANANPEVEDLLANAVADAFGSLVANTETEEDETEEGGKIATEKEKKLAARLKEKEEKEATRLKEKEEKEAKKKAAEEAKSQRIKEKEAVKAKKSETQKSKQQEQVVEEEEQDIVKKIEVDGIKYLKSKKTGLIYDYKSYTEFGAQVVLGEWNVDKKCIDFDASTKYHEQGDEEEEEYEEEECD